MEVLVVLVQLRHYLRSFQLSVYIDWRTFFLTFSKLPRISNQPYERHLSIYSSTCQQLLGTDFNHISHKQYRRFSSGLRMMWMLSVKVLFVTISLTSSVVAGWQDCRH